MIKVEERTLIQEFAALSAKSGGELWIGRNSSFSEYCNIDCTSGVLRFEGENSVSRCAQISSGKKGFIQIGKGSTFGSFLCMGCERASIIIGEDNMFSYFVKMNVGSHKIMDQMSGKEITNCKSIQTGNHVWIGMGATFLPGCHIESGSIVGAASVVKGKIPADSTWAGNPAKVLRNKIEWQI